MSGNISAVGLTVRLIAIPLFPVGFEITKFADDSDPLQSDNIDLKEYGMGLNGDLVYWKKATPIPVSISVIANSDDDENLTVLADSERVAKGKIAMNNDIIMNINYPNGSILILTNGQLTSAPLLKNVASQGRIKTNTYSFIFENKI